MSLPPGFTLIPERPGDSPAIESLLDLCFGADRHQKRSYFYREGVERLPELGLVALDPNAKLVGTIRYWPIDIVTGHHRRSALLLGPIAVEPELKGRGVGRALMRESLALAQAAGHGLVLLVGDAAYYGQFGFRSAAAHGFVMPHEQPHRLQAIELTPGAFAGGGVLTTHGPAQLRAPSRSLRRGLG